MRGGRGHEQSAVARQELNGRRDGVAEGVAEAAVEASMEYESVVERIDEETSERRDEEALLLPRISGRGPPSMKTSYQA